MLSLGRRDSDSVNHDTLRARSGPGGYRPWPTRRGWPPTSPSWQQSAECVASELRECILESEDLRSVRLIPVRALKTRARLHGELLESRLLLTAADFGDAVRTDLPDVGPLLSGLTVPGLTAAVYPAFAPTIQRYAIRTGAGELTVRAETGGVDDRLEIQGQPAESGQEVVIPGVQAGDKIRIELSDNDQLTRTYELIILPPHFPTLEVTTLEPGVSPGLVYVTLTLDPFEGPFFATMIDNNGVPAFLQESSARVSDFKLHPNGTRSFSHRTGIQNEFGRETVEQVLLDEQFQELGRVQVAGELNHTDGHDFLILPNGNYVFLSYNGEERPDPDAGNEVRLFEDSVVQVIDPQTHDELFQWNSRDHIPLADVVRNNLVEYAHANSVSLDHDGDFLLSLRGTAQVVKIDAQTGDVRWKLGGLSSDFEISDPLGGMCGQHTANRLPSGNILVFDNGFDCPDLPGYEGRGNITRAAEYRLDEVAMTAELVWSYAQDGFYASATGSAQRLTSGNTLIGWGRASAFNAGTLATEVDAEGNKLFEFRAYSAAGPWRSYRAVRYEDQDYPTLSVDGGAQHAEGGELWLGATVDYEQDARASGDDHSQTDDEDGVVFTLPLTPSQLATVQITSSATGYLNAWIDFNNDGDWSDSADQIARDRILAQGKNLVTFPVPDTAVVGAKTFARFRLDQAGGLSFGGSATSGEVEDHRVVIAPWSWHNFYSASGCRWQRRHRAGRCLAGHQRADRSTILTDPQSGRLITDREHAAVFGRGR